MNHAVHCTSLHGCMYDQGDADADDDDEGGIIDAAGGREEGVPMLHIRGTPEC